MDRRKKLLNFHEGETRKILAATAQRNDAEVVPKVRIADVVDVERSGLDDDLFGYALRAHFDFVVVDHQHMPLFAVEFDGPHHARDGQAQANDRRKNRICEHLGLPLARVRDEHIFRKARHTDYLTWLSEVFFTYQWMEQAQAEQLIPADEILDPMLMLSHPNVPGRFPLWAAGPARLRLREHWQRGTLRAPGPLCLRGYDLLGNSGCLAVIPVANEEFVLTTSSIYLRYFGISPSEVAEEIAVVSLEQLAAEQVKSGGCSVQANDVRQAVIRFLRAHEYGGGSGYDVELGFSLSYSSRAGHEELRIGALNGDPEVIIFRRARPSARDPAP